MIKEKHLNEKLPNELSAVFPELQVSNYLCQAFFHFSPVHNLLKIHSACFLGGHCKGCLSYTLISKL